jgi:regulator of protease activity HflC (stomatin/prohibitin superfamily)
LEVENEKMIELIIFLIVVGVISAVLFIIFYFKANVVVPFNEVHVIGKGNNVIEYDGKGRYRFIKFLHSRTIIPKHVLDIEPGIMDLHDKDNLPFGVEVSVKVQVSDPQKAAECLTSISHQTVSKVVEDTVMSSARSIAMERNILNIMKNREEIERAIYEQVADALSKLGLSAIIFDIKNIMDLKDSKVIASMERVKIAELEKDARISEAKHESEAEIFEVEKAKETKVKTENMVLEEEQARLNKEQEVATRQQSVQQELLKLEQERESKQAEIEKDKIRINAEAAKEKKMLEAKAEAESIDVKAKAQANAIKLKSEAEADGIKAKGLAEVEILQKKAKAMKEDPAVAQLKLMELLCDAQVKSSAEVANALGGTEKIMYIPDNGDNLLFKFLPKLETLVQSDAVKSLLSLLKPATNLLNSTEEED